MRFDRILAWLILVPPSELPLMSRSLRFVIFVVSLGWGAGVAPTYCQAVTSDPEVVEMFQAWDDRRIDIRYVALDASKGNLMIENLGTEAIVVRLPRAFGARAVAPGALPARPPVMRDFDAEPVLAQLGGGPLVGGQLGGQPGGGQGGGGAQNVGGNLQGGGQGFGGQGLGGQGFGGQRFGAGQARGFMRIPPGKTLRRSATTVCLNHGKPDPRPALEYRVVRLDQTVADPVLIEICAHVGSSALDWASGQAAAWHRTDSIDWKTLKAMPAHRSRYRATRKRFTPHQIESAQAFVNAARMHRPPVALASGQPESEKPERPYRSDGEGEG